MQQKAEIKEEHVKEEHCDELPKLAEYELADGVDSLLMLAGDGDEVDDGSQSSCQTKQTTTTEDALRCNACNCSFQCLTIADPPGSEQVAMATSIPHTCLYCEMLKSLASGAKLDDAAVASELGQHQTKKWLHARDTVITMIAESKPLTWDLFVVFLSKQGFSQRQADFRTASPEMKAKLLGACRESPATPSTQSEREGDEGLRRSAQPRNGIDSLEAKRPALSQASSDSTQVPTGAIVPSQSIAVKRSAASSSLQLRPSDSDHDYDAAALSECDGDDADKPLEPAGLDAPLPSHPHNVGYRRCRATSNMYQVT